MLQLSFVGVIAFLSDSTGRNPVNMFRMKGRGNEVHSSFGPCSQTGVDPAFWEAERSKWPAVLPTWDQCKQAEEGEEEQGGWWAEVQGSSWLHK